MAHRRPAARPTLRQRLPARRWLSLALLCWAVLSILDGFGAFRGADLKMLDWRFQIRGSRPASDLVVLVEIDDATITAFGDRWPLPRSLPAALISAVAEGGARAVGLDLVFLGHEPCDSTSDALLVRATASERGIVHAIAFPQAILVSDDSVAESSMSPLLRHGVVRDGLSLDRAAGVATPFPALLDAAQYLGHVNIAIDRDGVVRRAPLFLRHGDRAYPSLALSMVQAGLEKGEPPAVTPTPGGLDLAWKSGRRLFVPVDKEGATAIDFVGNRSAFTRTYSMLQVLEWSRAEQIDSLRDAFHGRLVVVGSTSMGHMATDLGTTPFEAATPLVYIHANFLNALVEERLLFRVPAIVRLPVLAVLALLVAYLTVILPPLAAVAVAVGSALAFAGVDFGLFLHGIDVPPTAGLILSPLVYSAVQSYRVVFVERRDRARARELAIAERIQRGLLPQSRPNHPAVDVFGINVPAQAIGGDYYDWIPVEDQGLAIAVGDVEGKGIGAALLMVHLHASFHSEMRTHRSPREAVDAMHRSLYEAAEARQFATFFLAVIDRGGRALRYCSAGHNPGLHVHRAHPQWLEATGLPLGMILDCPPYEDREIALAPGDVVVLYSDGITEYECKGEMYGEERLAAVVLRLAADGRPASRIAQGILEDVRAFARSGPASDDVTLVVIRQCTETAAVGDPIDQRETK